MPTQLWREGFIRVAITATAVASALSIEQSFTVPGLKLNDQVVVTKPTFQTGLGIGNARVDADNSLAITFLNTQAGTAVTPTAAEVYTIWWKRPENFAGSAS